MVAAAGLTILTLITLVLYFAAEAKDAKAELVALRVDLAQARAIRDAGSDAAKAELRMLQEERNLCVNRFNEMEDVIAQSPDPVARRHHLRELGKNIANIGAGSRSVSTTVKVEKPKPT